jgi:hypothetical protein
MDAADSQLSTLLELDARHDDLLQQLAELDHRVSQVLAECRGGVEVDYHTSSDFRSEHPE